MVNNHVITSSDLDKNPKSIDFYSLCYGRKPLDGTRAYQFQKQFQIFAFKNKAKCTYATILF